MKYYIIAGEASGDLHGSNLMKALFKQDEEADIRFWGGDLMQRIGGELVMHYKDRQFMGFAEVILNLRKVLGQIKFCKSDIEKFQPDVIIFIDNSGFNLRIAKWAKALNYKTHYYISPQVWASRASRVEKIKQDVDAMYCILPFEKAFYKKYDYDVNFVGHPLIDAIANRPQVNDQVFREEHKLSDQPIIALLPGSRKQEISRILPVMLETAKNLNYENVAIACTDNFNQDFYTQFVGSNENVKLVYGQAWNLLNQSDVALVTSGTATLETALIGCPQIVLYKTSPLSYTLGKKLIKVKHISLVNLILNRGEVVELIQNDVTVNNICKSIGLIQSKQAKLVKNELKLVLGNSKSKVEQFSFLV